MDNKEAVKKLLLLLNRYRKTIVVIVCCLFISTGLNLCVPLISRRIMDDGFIGGDKKLLIELVLASMAIYTVNSFIDIVKEKKRVDISAKIQYFLSEQSHSPSPYTYQECTEFRSSTYYKHLYYRSIYYQRSQNQDQHW